MPQPTPQATTTPYQPYQQSQQPAAPTPPRSGPQSVFARAFSPERLLPMLLSVAITLAASYVLGLLLSILTVLSIDGPQPWSIVAGLPVQLMGAGLFGTITGSVSAGALGMSISGSLLVFVVPLLFLLVQAGLLAATSNVAERRAPSDTASVRWITALAQGLAYAIVITLFALVGSIGYSTEGTTFSVTTASFSLFAGALVIMTISAMLGRAASPGARREAKPLGISLRLPAPLTSALWIALGYVIVASVIAGIALAIGVAAQAGPRALMSTPLWLPTATVDALAVMHFSQISSGGTLMQTVGTAAPGSLWIGSAPVWVVILDIVLVIVLIAVAGTALRLVRAARPSKAAAAWGSTIGAFTIVGVLVSLFGTVAASGSVGGFISGSVTAGPAPYTFLLFAALGALIEVVARYVGGYVLGLLPAGFVARLNGIAQRFAGSAPSVGEPVFAAGPDAGPAASGANTVGVTPAGATPVGAVPPGAVPPGAVPAGATPAGATPAYSAATQNGTNVADPNAATAAYATTASPTPAATPLDPRTKKRILLGTIVGGGVIVLAVLATVGLSIANGVVNAPQAKVSEYLDALKAGDASRALELSDVDAPNSERVLLNDEIFGAAEGRIASYDITSVVSSGNTTTVAAEVDQDGSKSSMQFTVVSRGKQWLFFDEWKLARPDQSSVSVTIPDTLDQLEVNGVPIELSADQRDGIVSLPAFPGRYDFSISKSSKWITAEPQSAMARPRGVVAGIDGRVQLQPEPTPALTEEIGSQVDAYLAACIASTSLKPDNCPNSAYFSLGNPTDVVWTMTKAPVYEVGIDYDGALRVTTTTSGSASVTYTSFGKPDRSSDRSIQVRGDVKIDGDKATFVPDTNGY